MASRYKYTKNDSSYVWQVLLTLERNLIVVGTYYTLFNLFAHILFVVASEQEDTALITTGHE